MKKGLALAGLATLFIALGAVTFVPSVQAQVSQAFYAWFRFETPDGSAGIGVGTSGSPPFAVLSPAYLPAEIQKPAVMVTMGGESGKDSVKMTYYDDEQFVAITQSKASSEKALPAGNRVTIKGQPAVLEAGLKGTMDLGIATSEGATSRPSSKTVAYVDGKRLTWHVGETWIEITSNLPEGEVMKIAESLVPAKAGEGEFGPPLGPLPGQQPASSGDDKGGGNSGRIPKESRR